jgi:diguanylate cyclase (GGDEF)-like protein
MGTAIEISEYGVKLLISDIVTTVHDRIKQEVVARIEAEVGPRTWSTDMSNLMARLQLVDGALNESKQEPAKIHEKYLPALKMAILEERLRLANEIDDQRRKVSNADVSTMLEQRLRKFDALMNADWFHKTEAAKFPRLTDVLTIECAEAVMSGSALLERQYDEKFHILQAPSLFRPDLDRFRATCGMRDLPVVVAFLDIDDFKKFNTDFTYPVIDLYFLPRFMARLEGHVFGRGYAYRFGGDEYVVTLPNADTQDGIRGMRSFQRQLENVEYPKITRKPTVSIGICEVRPGCPLTNGEILASAEAAKDKAKKEKKGAIAAFRNGSSEIYLVEDIQ